MPLVPTILQRLKVYKSWWEVIGFFVVIVSAVTAFNTYVDWKIDQRLSDPLVLKKLATSARPFCIFNNKGSILFDSGAMQFIGYPGQRSIDFSDLDKSGFPRHILIHFNRLLTFPPTLSLLGEGLTSTSAQRGIGYDWDYAVYSAQALVDSTSTSPPSTGEQDYKLEILF